MEKNSGHNTHFYFASFSSSKQLKTITSELLPMSALEFVSNFFTPTYLFLFLNLIIGTIFIASRLGSHRPAILPQPVPLARSPSSLIDRVRSINLSLYKFESHPEADSLHHDYQGPVQAVVDGPPLVRAPSLLGRLRSVNFYQHKFEHIDPEQEPEPLHPVDPPAPLSRAPSSLLDRLKSVNFYYQKFGQSGGPAQELDRSMDATDTAPLARAPSLLERVRSIKFPSFYESDPEPEHDDTNQQAKDRGCGPVRRIRSESEKIGEQGPKPRMRKTASEKSVADADAEEIDAKADDFIQRFRHQLRLQRLDSIMRYKDMLTGGGGGR